jgi:hypothetical protein
MSHKSHPYIRSVPLAVCAHTTEPESKPEMGNARAALRVVAINGSTDLAARLWITSKSMRSTAAGQPTVMTYMGYKSAIERLLLLTSDGAAKTKTVCVSSASGALIGYVTYRWIPLDGGMDSMLDFYLHTSSWKDGWITEKLLTGDVGVHKAVRLSELRRRLWRTVNSRNRSLPRVQCVIALVKAFLPGEKPMVQWG